MKTFADIQLQWIKQLAIDYHAREVTQILRLIMVDVFEWESADFLINKDEELPEAIQQELETFLIRLQTGEPVQHIIGFVYFAGLKMNVSEDVLIPRPETEELVMWICEDVDDDFEGAIEDWCTGSGCIALAMKHLRPQLTVRGYDISVNALEMARKNANALQLDVDFQAGDALSQTYTGEPVSVIVSNPPYVPVSEKVQLHRNVRDFEPGLALFVPDNEALLFYKALTRMAAQRLQSGGLLYFEMHEDFATQTAEMVNETGDFEGIEIRLDMYEKPRMLKAVRK